jgi:hypothetical protein
MPPANDDFASAQTVSGNNGSAAGDNTNGTLQVGEDIYAAAKPNGLGFGGGKSVWYAWTALATATVTFETSSSGASPIVDSVITVCTGGSVSTLTVIASDDDGGTRTYSLVSFAATLGSTYFFAVDGYNGTDPSDPGYNPANTSEGSFLLSWDNGIPNPVTPDVTSFDIEMHA